MADETRSADLRERPIGELMKQLAEETSTLVRQELDLAKAEMAQKGRKAGLGAGLLSGAAVFGLLALGALTAFFILALDGALPNWAAALIVAAVYGAIAGVLALRGKERVQEAGKPVPEQTKESIEEDLRWARTQVKSGGR
jgi:MFS family permease